MRTRLVPAAIAAALALTACSSESYEDITANCAKALESRAEGDKEKPSACKDVKEDDYDTLVISSVLEKDGWVDKDGEVNTDKLLNPDGTPDPDLGLDDFEPR
ncbi:hypothetical protein [Streptomyces sp. NPDC047315]|uniref:hypothetical protein n=1 Tax=Streptomyces sp. NPDC047315 TaxID=3155142 RepID=UPI0033CF834E